MRISKIAKDVTTMTAVEMKESLLSDEEREHKRLTEEFKEKLRKDLI